MERTFLISLFRKKLNYFALNYLSLSKEVSTPSKNFKFARNSKPLLKILGNPKETESINLTTYSFSGKVLRK